ncbi:MAG: hypothetical protein K8R68_02160, partial [Bacteroidales bacterium]|nr:hypothetical protein [Bacteroidales bacterium]
RLLALAVFTILIDFRKIELIRFEMILKVISDLFRHRNDMIYVIKYLDVGIRHLKMENKKAIYDLSKEERVIFEKFVLDKIKKD